jgi:hypothetical protein
MQAITEAEFRQCHVFRKWPDGYPTSERGWFKQEDLLCIVLLDMVDHDWSFVALARNNIGVYAAYDIGASFNSFEAARIALEQALSVKTH